MKKSLIILALLTMGSTAYAQVSAGGSASGSGSVDKHAISGQGSAAGNGSGNNSMTGNGKFGGTDIERREQAQAPSARSNNSNGINSQDRDKGLDRARDRMNEEGLEHNKAPGTNSR